MKWLFVVPPLRIFHSTYAYLHSSPQSNLLDKLAGPPAWTDMISKLVRLTFIIEFSLDSFSLLKLQACSGHSWGTCLFQPYHYAVSSKIVHLIILACLETKLIRLFDYNHHHQRNSTNQQIYTHFMCSVYSIIAKYDLLNCVLLTIHNYSWHATILRKYHNYVFPTYIVYFVCQHSS